MISILVESVHYVKESFLKKFHALGHLGIVLWASVAFPGYPNHAGWWSALSACLCDNICIIWLLYVDGPSHALFAARIPGFVLFLIKPSCLILGWLLLLTTRFTAIRWFFCHKQQSSMQDPWEISTIGDELWFLAENQVRRSQARPSSRGFGVSTSNIQERGAVWRETLLKIYEIGWWLDVLMCVWRKAMKR